MIRVCVADDQTLVRQGIRSLLELSDEVSVVGEASDGAQALRVLAATRPDVLLLDLRMPGMDGIDTLTALGSREGAERDRDGHGGDGHGGDVPAVATLVLTTFDDDELVIRALRAGALGYLLKDVTLETLVHGIRTVAGGGSLVQPTLTDRVARAVGDLPARRDAGGEVRTDAPVEHLTPREREILRLLAAGYANREIAAALHLAEGTVKNHVSSLLTKLEVRDRTRAVLRALHLGLLTERDAGGGHPGGASGGPK